MKRLAILFTLVFCVGALMAQSEHYDTHPKFTHEATPAERVLLQHWYLNAKGTTPPVAPVTAIAEFQPMGGVLIAYPLGVPVSLVRELSLVTQVTVIVSSGQDSTSAKYYFASNGVNSSNMRYWLVNHDSYWVRDYGPWFVLDGNDQIGIVDFTYNRPSRPHDDAAMQYFIQNLGVPSFEMSMVHTGGNYMVDGYGTAASTDLVLEENPTMTAADVQAMAHDYLGIDNYMLLNDPLGEYIAHIDCWGKFLGVDKVLIAQVATSDPRYNAYEQVANTFANALTPWGNHYRVYRVYAPGNNAKTPYTNSLILNDHVFLPTSGNQYDNGAIAAYEQAMPGYTIVPIQQTYNASWQNTDALHCRTHELADLGMLYLKHYPLLGHQVFHESYDLPVTIKALSGQALITDSLLAYYRIDEGPWQSTLMQHDSGDVWHATLTGLQADSEVDYYLFAKDASGRRECLPYIGAADPFHFTLGGVGVEENAFAHLALYPNPTSDNIVLRGKNLSSMTLYNQMGQQVMQVDLDDYMIVDCHTLPAGVYVAVIRNDDGKTCTKRVVKIK
ncbi:MAG: agmatine deiminase family protein [Bacteroidales bacterium]|nr:agmatine deiminase family protein [Bacteroidales bacterium]